MAMRPMTHHGGHRMDPRTIAGALAALYASAVAAGGYATDVVTGDRATAAGVAAVIGAIATGSALLLYRSSQASAAAHSELMDRLRLELTEHAATRARLDVSERRQADTERKLERAEHRQADTERKLVESDRKLAGAEAELERLRHRLEEIAGQRE